MFMNKNKFDDIEIQKYKSIVEKYLVNDNRELNYQNRIVIPFLKRILPEDLDIVDTSTLYKNWENREWHDRSKYADNYTPDILIAKEWTIYNRNKDNIEYLSLLEIKTPTANNRKHAEKEKNEYLSKVPTVILTDCLTWEFFPKNKFKYEVINFEEGKTNKSVCQRDNANKKIAWKAMPDLFAEFQKLMENFSQI